MVALAVSCAQKSWLFLIVIAALLGGGRRNAHAQALDRRFEVEPTQGIALPATALAGEHDGRALSANPAGLHFLSGPEALLVFNYSDPDTADAGGTGGGLFIAGPAGGTWLPRLGIGVGLEFLRPSRSRLLPDPGTPVRASLAASWALSRDFALGLSWHHFFDDGPVDGLDVWDLGASTRIGNRLAVAAVVRDLNSPRVQGVLVQRRYEGELAIRPTGTDRLDLGIGGRIGEVRGNVDGWVRGTLRLSRGLYAQAAVESRELSIQTTSGAQVTTSEGRDLRAMLGIEISLGGFGVTSYGTAFRDDRGSNRAMGGGLVLRSSLVAIPSLVDPRDHIERVELGGSLEGFQLVSLVARLRSIGRDDSARAVALVFEDLSAGWGALREVRGELALLRKAGKKLYAFMVSGDTRDYYLASVADRVYLDPAGSLSLIGLSATSLYWRGALDLVGVTPEFEKIAEFKSAPEQYTRAGPSAPAVQMRGELLDGIWSNVVTEIASSRGLRAQDVQAIVDQGPYSAGDLASDRRLIDAVATPERAAALIASDLGTLYPVRRPPLERPASWLRPKIAVIHLQGDIVDGTSQELPLLGRKMSGGETISAAIVAARLDDEIGAIILRIDSPGGSALASEQIAREVFATRGVKPILCSMSNVAASGGYFAAAGCDLIFAQPTTVTGSIGIFFGKFDLSGLMARVGVSADVVLRGKHSDLGTVFRPYRPEERELLHAKIRYMYGRFVGAVAEGRGQTRAQIDSIGRGRVWTGLRAKEVGLVDRMGGVGDAIDEARRRMGMAADERVDLLQLPRVETSVLSRLSKLGGLQQQPAWLVDGALQTILSGLLPSLLMEPGVAQARLPFDLNWE